MKLHLGTPKSKIPKTSSGQKIVRKNTTDKPKKESIIATRVDGEVIKLTKTGKVTESGLAIVKVAKASVNDKIKRDNEIMKQQA